MLPRAFLYGRMGETFFILMPIPKIPKLLNIQYAGNVQAAVTDINSNTN